MAPETKNEVKPNGTKEKEEKWGFDLYPERRSVYEPSATAKLWWGENPMSQRLKCEKNVWNVINKSPVVKLLISALSNSGCPFDIERHIVCEVCDNSLLGGYDQTLNQIVVCQNVCTNEGRVQGALAHELVHMFDYCRNKIDFTNIDHLACAEVKAANLTSCSFLTSLTLPKQSLFNIAKSHEECVKTKAAWSVKYARDLSEEESRAAVEKVFPKCYNDLEPIGRRPRRNSYDYYKAYRERHLYGY
ncbi:UNVERIFIED_CONTAM: hypothetical protein RMT77_016535 [Armadillidium vulgare]